MEWLDQEEHRIKKSERHYQRFHTTEKRPEALLSPQSHLIPVFVRLQHKLSLQLWFSLMRGKEKIFSSSLHIQYITYRKWKAFTRTQLKCEHVETSELVFAVQVRYSTMCMLVESLMHNESPWDPPEDNIFSFFLHLDTILQLVICHHFSWWGPSLLFHQVTFWCQTKWLHSSFEPSRSSLCFFLNIQYVAALLQQNTARLKRWA